MRSLMTLVLVVLMAVPSLGCGAGPNTWTEGDRKSLNQSKQGTSKSIRGLEALAPLVMDRPAASEAIAEIKSDLVTVEINLVKTEEIHGPPKEIVPFSEKASAAARKQQADEHAGRGFLGWVMLIGSYVGGALTLALTVLNMPVVGPFLATTKVGQVAARVLSGPIVKMGLDAVKTISKARSEAEDKPLTAQDIVRLAVQTASPTSAKIADKVSDQLEAANKIEVTPIRELATTPS